METERAVQLLGENTQIQIEALYAFPSVDAVALYLVSEAVRRQADYIEVCLEDRGRIDLEVRDNGRAEAWEDIKRSQEMRLLGGLGSLSITTYVPFQSFATLFSLNSLEMRPTSRLRKPGQITSILSLYSMFPPREKEYLASNDHSSLNLSVLRPILIHPDVHIVVKVRGETRLELGKSSSLRERLSTALGGDLFEPVTYRQGTLEVTGAIAGLSTLKAQFLYMDKSPIDCVAIKAAVDTHFQSAVMGKAKRSGQISLVYVLNLHFDQQPQVRSEGSSRILELGKDLMSTFDDILHIMLEEKLGIAVKCDRKGSLKRKLPAALKGLQKHTIHADISDKELLEILDRGEEAPIQVVKRPKLAKPQAPLPRFPQVSSLVEEVCSESSKATFALPAALQSFLKFASATVPNQSTAETHRSFTLSVSDFASLAYIGQYDDKCLLGSLQKDGHLLVVAIDQHAAHERVNLEDLQARVLDCVSASPAYIELPLSLNAVEILRNAEEKMQKWGFAYTIEESQRKVSVQSVPVVCGRPLAADSLLSFATEVSFQGTPLAIHSILCSKACKQAVKFGNSLPSATAIDIISRLSQCQLGLICAHGRPTAHILLAIPLKGNRSRTPVHFPCI